MRDGVPPALKWLGAFAGMALVVAITVPMAINAITESFRIQDSPAPPAQPGGDEDTDPPEEAPEGAVEDGDAVALADFSGRNAAVRQAQEVFVAIGGVADDAVYFAFPLVDGDPACVEEVRLELTLLQSTPEVLILYPAGIPEVLDVGDGDPLPAEPFVTDEPRAVAETDGTPGVLFWDVTSVYQEWAAGELVEDPEPLVLAVRPAEYGDADIRVQFASVESDDETAPRLVWSGVPDCG